MIESIESIRRVDKKGYLYEMNCTYDYYHLPPQFMAYLQAGCSVFITKNREGETLFCRNYDFSHFPYNDRSKERTGLNMVVHGNNPNARYKSLGAGDMYWIDFANGSIIEGMCDDGKSDLSPFVLAPFLCMDGMNEEGVAICILSLLVEAEWKEIPFETCEEKMDPNKQNLTLETAGELPKPYLIGISPGSVAVNTTDQKAWIAEKRWIRTTNPGKPTVLHPVLMRMVLDNCANVDEAVALISSHNVVSAMAGADYHIMVADKSGKSRLIEWLGNEIHIHDINHATNHFVSKDDPFFPFCNRDNTIEAGLRRFEKGGMSEAQAKSLLELVVQDPANNNGDGKTQYSCIYNLNQKTLKIFAFGDMTVSYDYSLE